MAGRHWQENVRIRKERPSFAPEILLAAAEYGFRVLAYLPGRKPAVIQQLVATGKILISKEPVRLSSLEDDIDIGIWQSPTGGVGHSLEKGMRMLFLPSQAEQFLACTAVERSGVPAKIVTKRENWSEIFDSLLAMPRMNLGRRWEAANIPRMAELLLGQS